MLKRTLLGCAMGVMPFCVSPVFAADAASAPVTASAAELPEIVVMGAGQTRQIQTISAVQIEEVVPGTSPIKVLQSLPGVNFQSSDPFGAYEWATRISVRGFDQEHMGFTLDGVPLGNMFYGNDNGLHISRAISSENLGASQLSEGTGGLSAASTSNLGGVIEFHSRAPSRDFGVDVEGTYGSYSTQHEFIRLDTGELPGGGTAYLSYSHQESDKWKGYGKQKQDQFNGKIVQPIGDKVKVTAFVNYSDRAENDYQDLNRSLINQFGYKLDNISNNAPLAIALANAYNNHTAYPAPFTNTKDGDAIDAVYYNGSGLRKDTLGGFTVDWDILDNLTAHLTGYGHNNTGQGTWDTPYLASPDGTPISLRTTEYYIMREGGIGSLEYKIAGHDIEGGFWYERNNFNEARRYYALNSTLSNRNNLDFQIDPFYTQRYSEYSTDTTVFHLQDTWKITDELKLNYGFKTQDVDVTAISRVGGLAAGEIKASDDFLPQVGVNYSLHHFGEVFADYAQNQNAFIGAETEGPFSTTQAGFDAIKGSLKPETSKTGEVGYRYHEGPVQGSIVGYYTKFDNRLLGVSSGAAIIGAPVVLANVGSVTTKGVELTGAWKIIHNWTISGSYAYNDSRYDQNVGTQPTGGKTVVDSPKNIAHLSLAYDDGSLFANVDGDYMSKRYYTYDNDQSVGGRTIFNLSAGYRFSGPGVLKGVEIQGNITNVLDKKYVATMGTNGYTFTGDYQTLQAGAPREAFITLRKQF